MHNYHDTYKTFPFAWMVDLSAGMGPGLNAQVWGTRILPYLEQQALYDLYDSRYPSFNEFSAIPAVAQNLTVIETPLTAFVCPSTPGDAEERTYDASLQPDFPLSWRAAPSDYSAIAGVYDVFSNLAYANWTGSGSRNGVMQTNGNDPATMKVDNSKSRIADILDGTANTAMIGERVGGDKIYEKGGRISSMSSLLGPSNGGGWGDIMNGEMWYGGTLYDGTGLPGHGPCAINCSNYRNGGFFSFHPGGAQFCLADGSVRFVSETTDAFTLASLTTRSRGEVAPLP